MKKNIGMLLLAIYLILIGVIGLFGISLGKITFLISSAKSKGAKFPIRRTTVKARKRDIIRSGPG